MIRSFICTIILLSAHYASAINQQTEIQQAQEWASSFNRPYPIFVFDRDTINFLYLSNNLIGEDKIKQRLKFLGQYLANKTGVELSYGELETLDSYLTQFPELAVAQPLLDSNNHSDYKFCAVFPLPPNGNSRIETERMLALDFKTVYPTQTFEQLSKKLSLEALYLFSLYHEVSHCLDPKFMPATLKQGQSESPSLVHLSEAFAETLSYLKLSQRLDKNIADARALYRTIYSRKMGTYFATEKKSGFYNPYRKFGGAIYYLTPYLMSAYTQIRFGKLKVDQMNSQQLLSTAVDLINDNAIESRDFAAIMMGLSQGFTPALEFYQKQAFDSPDFFYQTYLKLNDYKSQTDYWVAKAFTKTTTSAQDQETAPALPVEKLCQTLDSHEKLSFLNIINDFRSQINEDSFSSVSSKERYTQLIQIQNILTTNCTRTTK